MKIIAEQYIQSVPNVKEAKKNQEYIYFLYGGNPEDGDDDVGEQIREFVSLPEKYPVVALLDIPKACMYMCDTKITQKSVIEFFQAYQGGLLTKTDIVA